MGVAAVPAAIGAVSLIAGLKTGVTQGVIGGDAGKVKAGLGQVAKGNLNMPDAKNILGLTAPITKTPTIPTANSDSVNQAKLKSLFDLQNRSGRASTLLTTATTNKFGG